MTNEIEISPEIAKLAHSRTRSAGITLGDELARNIAEEAVLGLDVEAGFILDDSSAYSREDALIAALGVNDVVINGCRFDVRTVDEDGRVAISRALLGTSYMQAGTLAVQMTGPLSGSVVAFVSNNDWEAVDKHAEDQQTLFVRAKVQKNFDLEAAVQKVLDAHRMRKPSSQGAPEAFELATFVANRNELKMAKQRQIVESVLTNEDVWIQLKKVVSVWSKASVRKVLTQGATWNARAEKITNVLSTKFRRLSRTDVKAIVIRTGESFGGQPEAPEFRKALMVTLAREELSHSLGGALLKKANMVVEEVISGRKLNDTIKDFAKNSVAVALASQIKQQRQRVGDFMEATSQEMAAAFQQLSLQPVYATHSQDPQAGIESINEVLKLLEAGDLAERIKEAEAELSNI